MSSNNPGSRPPVSVPGIPSQLPFAPNPYQQQQQQGVYPAAAGYAPPMRPPTMPPGVPAAGFVRPGGYPQPPSSMQGQGFTKQPSVAPPPMGAPPLPSQTLSRPPASILSSPNPPQTAPGVPMRPVPPYAAQAPPGAFVPPTQAFAPPQFGTHAPPYGSQQQQVPTFTPPSPRQIPPNYGAPQQIPPPYSQQMQAPYSQQMPPPYSQQQQQQQQQQGYYAPPPVGGVQGTGVHSLVEDFESLSLASVPGSAVETRPEALPRPAEATTEQPMWSNCHSRYFELTTNAIPNAHSLAARWHLPLGAVIHPLAEAPPGEEVPVVDFGASGIVRCRRCRTYINPYATFTDAGRYWRCSICLLLNDVPVDYMCGLDGQGKRTDLMDRPELSRGSVDFVAPTEYMVRPPMPPVYFFLIDVSVSAVRSGMLQVAVDAIKSSLDKLPGFPRTQIGFLTFDSALHFYNLKSSLTQPQMVVVAQLDDPFLPMPDDLLVNLSESRAVVEALLDSLPSIFADNDTIESALGPALQATVGLMGELGGKLLVFQSTLPSLGVGRLKLRGEDARIYGTDRENTLRVAEDTFYKQMAAESSKLQIGINVYAFSEKYTDLASLGTLAKYTGGQVYYYPAFHASVDGERFRYDLSRDLTRETAWEAVMRIRCGKGLKYSVFQGHFMLRSSDLLALPAVDCDKAFSVQFSLEDTLLTSQLVYFQVALLYTSSAGERRIRVHTAAIPVVSDLGEMYRAANVGAIMGVLSRLAIEKSLSDKLENARQFVQAKMVNALREFRNLHAVKHQLMGRMVFPESLRLLPLYVLGLCKCLALRGGFMDATADERSSAGFEIMIMSESRLLKLLYPTLIRLDEYLLQGSKPEGEGLDSPQQLPLTMEVLDPRGAFLYSDGLRFVLWMGNVLQPEFVLGILGPQVAHSSDLRRVPVQKQDTDLSKRFHSLLGKLRKQNPASYQHCLLVRQGEASRELQLVHSNLIEDRTAGFPSYAEWMIQINRQVQQKV